MTEKPSTTLRRVKPGRSPYSRLIARLLPTGRRTARENFQARFLLGANLLGLVVAIFNLVPTVLAQHWTAAAIVGAFAAILAAQTVALCRGGPIHILVWAAISTVAFFLTTMCLVAPALEPTQLQWLLLVPLVALLLMDPERRRGGHFLPLRPVLIFTLVAIGLGLGVIAAKQFGISLGEPTRPPDTLDITVNFLSFMLAMGGLLYLYDRSMRAAVAELATLRQLLAMCAWCKLIRDERGEWVKFEHYLASRDTEVTHAICPSCMRECLKRPE